MSLIARRQALIDAVIDQESAIAAASILLRLQQKLPEEFLDRLRTLDLLTVTSAHFARIHTEADYDQSYACARLLALIADGVSLIALLGPGGSGKTHVAVNQLLPAIRVLGHEVMVTSPTNLGCNVLRRRGVTAVTNHNALYVLGFGPSAVVVEQWLRNDGVGILPEDVSSRLMVAWRNATPGQRDRAQRKATVGLTEAALKEIGFSGGFMDILPPRWETKTTDDATTKVACWLMDEASMATSQTLEDIQALAEVVILIGDPFQLPAILERAEMLRGVTGALAKVPLQHQVHLFKDRRTRGETQHLRAAAAILRDDVNLTDIERWAREGEIPGLSLTRGFDLDQLRTAPALCFYRSSVIRIGISARRIAKLPDDQLVPGERLLIESIARDQRDAMTALGISKNSRVLVLRQTSHYQALVIAEHVLAELVVECETAGREPEREEVLARAAVIAVGVTYARDELEDAGIAQIDGPGMTPIRGQAVTARFGYASTTHKAQGSSYPKVQISGDDMAGYARSGYGNEVSDDLPIPVWRRLVYTSLTRAEESVTWVREGRAYRAPGAALAGTLNAAALLATLPASVRDLDDEDTRSELDAALRATTATAASPFANITPVAAPRSPFAKVTSMPASTAPATTLVQLPTEQPGRSAQAELDDPPRLLQDLFDWLMAHPELIPQQVPAPDGESFRFLVTWSGGRPRGILLERHDRTGLPVRRSLLRTDSSALMQAPPMAGPVSRYRALLGGLHHDDAEELTAALRRVQRRDPTAFRGLVNCASCGHALTDPVSRQFGIGPVCARRFGLTLPSVTASAAKECGA